MHEFSIARALIDEVRTVAAEQGGGHVTAVELDVGPLSGIEPQHLIEAFRQLRDDCGLARTELHLNEVPLVALCNRCRCRFEIRDFHFVCRHCGNQDVAIEQGEGVIIRTLTLQADSPAEASICPSM